MYVTFRDGLGKATTLVSDEAVTTIGQVRQCLPTRRSLPHEKQWRLTDPARLLESRPSPRLHKPNQVFRFLLHPPALHAREPQSVDIVHRRRSHHGWHWLRGVSSLHGSFPSDARLGGRSTRIQTLIAPPT